MRFYLVKEQPIHLDALRYKAGEFQNIVFAVDAAKISNETGYNDFNINFSDFKRNLLQQITGGHWTLDK